MRWAVKPLSWFSELGRTSCRGTWILSDGWRNLDQSLQFIIDFETLRRLAPTGYGFEDLDGNSVVLQVGKAVKFAGRPAHNTYWRFLGKRQATFRGRSITGDVAWFYRWTGFDEMAPGWGGPATAGFALILGVEGLRGLLSPAPKTRGSSNSPNCFKSETFSSTS